MTEVNGLHQRVILVAVGGATCSGKTTLAKHLRRCIPNSFIIHQDDFAPPQELIPLHPVYQVQDWDDAPGAIDWPRFRSFLGEIKTTGIIPDSHKSHDHLNEQKDIPMADETLERWRDTFSKVIEEHEEKGEKLKFGLVDGFLLYWDEEATSCYDARLFLRVPHDVLRKRRHERHGYHTAVQSDPEGALWRDPPEYFDQIVYPAYVRAHERMFTDGDIERGQPNGNVPGLVLIDCEKLDMDKVFKRACEAVLDVSR